jgi:hypothetical protein
VKSHEDILQTITLSGKNHFGSLRTPDAQGITDLNGNLADPNKWYNMHASQVFLNPATGSYRDVVDLMGHQHVGGKTVLYMAEAMFRHISSLIFNESQEDEQGAG